MKNNSTGVTIALILAAIVIAAFPMFFNVGDKDSDEPFAGTDSTAETLVEDTDPGYEPWFEPLVGELPGEVESGLFALQAALGAGLLGYVIGLYRGRSKWEQTSAQAPASQ